MEPKLQDSMAWEDLGHSEMDSAVRLLSKDSDVDLRIINATLGQPKRYGELRALLRGKSDNNLTVALSRLQQENLVVKLESGAEDSPRYSLTPFGIRVALALAAVQPLQSLVQKFSSVFPIPVSPSRDPRPAPETLNHGRPADFAPLQRSDKRFRPPEKSLLRNSEAFRPFFLPPWVGRAQQLDELQSLMTRVARGHSSGNILVYGKTGTGKTAAVRSVAKQVSESANVHFVYLNCAIVDTQYRVLQNISNSFIKDWTERIPFTGWPTDRIYEKLRGLLESAGGVLFVILDEADKLSDEGALSALLRLGEELRNSRLCIVVVSEHPGFTEFLEPRTRSRLREQSIVFPPYDALELQEILRQRAAIALAPDALGPGAIPLTAAFAALEHGDARRAIELLRTSVEIADRKGSTRVEEDHVREAHASLETNRVEETIRTLPTHCKLVLAATIRTKAVGLFSSTLNIHEAYAALAKRMGVSPVTRRRLSDILRELVAIGILAMSESNRKTGRQVAFRWPESLVSIALREDERLRDVI